MSSEEQPSPTYKQIVSTYTARFGKDDDQATVTEEQRQTRQQTAAEGADQYYDFATAAYLSGWGEHFHYCPFAPGEPILQAMAFYAHRLAYLMGLKPGMKVLDVGSGVGGPAREIAKFIGCEIVGISINQRQVDRAIEMTAEAGLSGLCTFVKGNFLDLPFPDSSFDAAYAIAATVHAPSLSLIYAGIARVLKPNAPFGLSEWVLKPPKYDPKNLKHTAIRNRIERGNGISNLQTSTACRSAFLAAGFNIEHDEDYAEHWRFLSFPPSDGSVGNQCMISPVTIPGYASPYLAPPPLQRSSTTPDIPQKQPRPIFRPWHYPLTGTTAQAETWADWWITWRMSPLARTLSYYFVWIMEHLGLLFPEGSLSAMKTIAYCVDSVVDGAQEGIFTPCWWFIGRKVNAVDEGVMEDERRRFGDDWRYRSWDWSWYTRWRGDLAGVRESIRSEKHRRHAGIHFDQQLSC